MGKTNEEYPEKVGSRAFTNILLYLVCITSLCISIYTNFHHSHLEDILKNFQHMDDRIHILEAKLKTITLPQSFTPTTLPASSAASTATPSDYLDLGNVMQKISLQVAGIDRLRRDVSHLQLSRRERQASIQQSPDCVCQPGK